MGSELLFAILLGLPLTQLGVGGVAWIFGGIVAGVGIFHACRIFAQYSLKPNRKARQIGQILVGLAIGFSTARGNLLELSGQLPIFVLLTLFMLVSGGLIGYLYARLTQHNLLTAMLATVPGSVGIMSSIAADYGKNVALVALIQIIRLTSVIVVIPLLARLSVVGGSQRAAFSIQSLLIFETSTVIYLILLACLTIPAIYLALFLRIPAAHFFAALIVGMSFNPLFNLILGGQTIKFILPPLINLIGQLLLGITIGEYWASKPKLGKKTIVYALIPVTLTIVAGFIAAGIAMLLTPWDWLTCLLVTAPGGAPEIILVALALDHHVEIVTAGHLVRLIAINGSLPLWVLLFRYLDGRTHQAASNSQKDE